LEEARESTPPKKAKTDDAVTEPTETASAETEDVKPAANGSNTQPVASKLKPESQNNNKEYFEYLPSDDSTIASIMNFFGIDSRFPRDRFMVKNKEGLSLNKIYYTSAMAKTIISQNKDRGMKFIHCGVVMFVAHKIKDMDKSSAPWRLQNEGIRILEPWAKNRIVKCEKKETLHQLICEMFPKLPAEGDTGLGEVGAQLQAMDVGCCFVRVEKDDEQGIPFRMVLPLWRHPGSANLMVDKDDRRAMLLRLFNEKDTEIINHVAEKARKELEAKEAEDAADEDAKGGEGDVSDGEQATEDMVAREEEGETKLDEDVEMGNDD
jgi:multisite-specific tRNA:(cytosine-C5)-methyltransferase